MTSLETAPVMSSHEARPLLLLVDDNPANLQVLLYLHSDGFLDETNPQGDAFGLERLHARLLSTRNQSLAQSIDGLIDAVVAWRGGTTLSDDVTAVAIERLPARE